MKKMFWAAVLIAVLPTLAFAQTYQGTFTEIKRATLLSGFDLDGEAADNDQVIAATALVDNGTSVEGANWTILAQPDVCRLLDLTIVDTNLNSGSITVAGTGCLDEARSCSFAFTAGDDTGTKILTCTDGQGAYFKNVATVTTGVMSGESDETFALGYTTNSANGWAMWGRYVGQGPSGERIVDPFGVYQPGTGQLPITTSGVLTTTVTSVATNAAFTNVVVGDLLIFDVGGFHYERKVTARASANSITVNAAVNIPVGGVPFQFKHFYFTTNPADQAWVEVAGYASVTFPWSVDANADTGGVITKLECLDENGPDFPLGQWVQIATSTVATGTTQAPTTGPSATEPYVIDLTKTAFSFCRFGLKFGTGDDADAANEDINLSVMLRK